MINILAWVIGFCLTIISVKLTVGINDHWKKSRTEGILHELKTAICSSVCAVVIVLIWGAVYYICN